VTEGGPAGGPAPRTAPATGPRVVLVPGLGLDERDWDRVRAALPLPSSVVRLPVLGTRPRRGARYDVAHLAAALSDALDLVAGSAPVVLGGHSAGCPVAIETARRDDRVVGLLLVGPVTDPRARGWARILVSWGLTALRERLWEVPVLVPQYLRIGVFRTVLRGMDRIRWYDTAAALDAVDLPVTLVRGEHDRIAPTAWLDRLAAHGGRRVVTVPGGAHMVTITHPAQVADELSSLVARCARRAP